MTEQIAKEMFVELVNQQDAGVPVADSKRFVAEQFGVSLDEVRGIERLGLDQTWPPLK
jgi:hypothetical protein